LSLFLLPYLYDFTAGRITRQQKKHHIVRVLHYNIRDGDIDTPQVLVVGKVSATFAFRTREIFSRPLAPTGINVFYAARGHYIGWSHRRRVDVLYTWRTFVVLCYYELTDERHECCENPHRRDEKLYNILI